MPWQPRLLQEAAWAVVGARLAREAENLVCLTHPMYSFAGKPRSYKVSAMLNHKDLARRGSKTCKQTPRPACGTQLLRLPQKRV